MLKLKSNDEHQKKHLLFLPRPISVTIKRFVLLLKFLIMYDILNL